MLDLECCKTTPQPLPLNTDNLEIFKRMIRNIQTNYSEDKQIYRKNGCNCAVEPRNKR